MKSTQMMKNHNATGLDDILCEQIKHLGTKTMAWLREIMNNILVYKKFLKLWRKSKVIAILKLDKKPSLPKRYIPISLMCHKLFERMILNRMNPITEHSHFPYTSYYSSMPHNTNRKHNIHIIRYTNTQHISTPQSSRHCTITSHM